MNEIERAIKYWEKFKQESVEMIAKGKDRNDILAKQVPMCDIALAALREQAERENSKPLTLDELRQMEGEVVWTVTNGVDGSGRWEIIEYVTEYVVGEFIKLCNPADLTYNRPVDSYGNTWRAYRHKPERSEG